MKNEVREKLGETRKFWEEENGICWGRRKGKRTKREIWEKEQINRKERDGLIKDKKKMKYQDEIKRRKNEKGENIEEGEKKRKKRNVRW